LAASVEAANADPELSWEHARAALSKASRVGIVREVAAESAYHAGHFAEALTEFRAARRMRGIKEYWPLMADCERALGRPAKAIAMAADPLVASLDRGSKVEMRIVASGARVDQGKLEAALATLQCPDLTTTSTEPWAVRIRYAYADVLEKLGRDAEALEWFHRAAAVDVEDQTDANDRIARLEGVVYEEVEEFDDYEDEDEDETSETEEFSDDE
jgi:tetratricopeptide (TPR) repeat protein